MFKKTKTEINNNQAKDKINLTEADAATSKQIVGIILWIVKIGLFKLLKLAKNMKNNDKNKI